MSRIDSLLKWLGGVLDTLVPSGSLADRTVKSGVWAGATNVLDRGLQLLALVVLARLLAPQDFGLMGIALLSLSGLKRFSRLGLDTALIQRERENVDRYLNTAWSMQLVRGLVLASLLAGAAPFLARFFGEPRAVPILRVIAVSPLLFGLRNPGVVYFRKSLEFHKNFLFNMSGAVTYFVVSVGYALIDPTVWALVFAYLGADIARLLASYLLHGYRPWPEFDVERARELISYGKWITGTAILYYLFTQGDDIVVGAVLAASSLGFYQVAYRLSNAPATEITHIIGGVVFPTFSKIQNETERLRNALFRTLRIVTFVSFPMAVGIFVVAPTFVRGFLGAQWTPMIAAMQILAVLGILRSFSGTFGSVFRAVGRPDYTTKLNLVVVFFLAVFIYPGVDAYGIEGAAFAVLLSFSIRTVVSMYLVVDIVETTYRRLFRSLAYPFVASGIMGTAVVATQRGIVFGSAAIEFVVLVVLGVGTYALVIPLIDRRFEWGIESDLRLIVRSVLR